MAEINDLSITDSLNTARFPEGQAPSTVNNGARALEGLLARFHKDINGSAVAGGTGDAITVAANQTLTVYYDGLTIAFEAAAANTGAATLNVDSVGAQAIRKNFDQALAANDIKAGQKVICIYDADNTRWQIVSPLGNPSAVLGANTFTGTQTLSGAALNGAARVDVASAATTNVGAAASNYVRITGTTTITALDTVASGIWRDVVFGGAMTLTHNATTLILPGGANVATAAGDTAIFFSEGSGNWRCVSFTRASALEMLLGKHSVWVPASATTTRTTNGPTSANLESTTNKVMRSVLDFDASTDEFAQFHIRSPKSNNEGTMTAVFVWENASGTGDVVWGIQGLARSDDDAIDTAFGTAVTVTDSVTAAGDVMISAETSAFTIGGTIAEGDWLSFQVYRDADAGGDTLAVDARLIGVMLFITYDAGNDA